MNKIDEKYFYKTKALEDINDIEEAHFKADELLLEMLEELGIVETCEAFRNLEKWYA